MSHPYWIHTIINYFSISKTRVGKDARKIAVSNVFDFVKHYFDSKEEDVTKIILKK